MSSYWLNLWWWLVYFNRVFEIKESGIGRTGYFIYDSGGNLYDFQEESLFLNFGHYIEVSEITLSQVGFNNLKNLATGKAVRGIQ